MYTEDNGNVVITISHGDYTLLLLALGYALGAAMKTNDLPSFAQSFLRLSNTINDGNPDWEPYFVPDPDTGELHEKSMVDPPSIAW